MISKFLTLSLGIFVALGVGVSNASGATFTVTNTDDNSPGSLRWAINVANVNNEDDVISFDPAVFNTPRVITLTSGELLIRPDNASGTVRGIAINGPGANLLEINGNNNSRIFRTLWDARLSIDRLKLS